MTFETNPRFLRDLLAEAHDGRLQLPDFQRSYVWGDEDVRMLIASILRGFPVGALLTLRTGGTVAFRPRLLEGVEAARKAAGQGPAAPAEELLLDGQQRITSLYGALKCPLPMTVRKPKSERKTLRRFYYLDIARALDAGEELEDAILGLPESRIRRDQVPTIDLSDRTKEFEAGCFPLNLAFDQAAVMKWLWDYQAHWQGQGASRSDQANAFMEKVLQPLQSYQMPTIRLGHETSREAVCLIFEKVNVGGKKLDAFELVTAIFAGSPEPLNLREDWAARFQRIRTGKGLGMPVFDHLRGFDFLQAVSLAATHAARRAGTATQVSCRREALLGLSLADFRAHAPAVEEGFREAGRFLAEQKVLWAADLPYPAQGVALAAFFAIGGKAAQSAVAREKLERWFWRTSLAEDYGSSPESKLAKDAEEVTAWLMGGPEPERMKLLTFNPDRLDSLRMRVSAAYRAFSALLLRQGCRDFITGKPADITTFHSDPMDVHHIFPRAWCERKGIRPEDYDSILNKTPLTAASNREIGGDAPSDYLARIEAKHGILPDQRGAILRSHLIEPDFLRTNDFKGFIADRKAKLAALAAQAMGLPLATAAPAAPPEPEGETDEAEEAA
ncbi:hypothetical protein ruthe_02279 [Rubellimicrobium thermophilum DSM 16684]|uniref:GmrSD restriction endonucleases N-terminal domain-containing protein n=1 Tax=Rubellimicrobium thermophilum DSM 16684 TaxID=1123069 RepID=S9QXK1_9RHOB|nr:DUF262 domain-containing protein [Rubellimicrobium thermophilum]EPX84373.1 hypothetical protein ruthe_02279 [Rubellimicrobium thermophilum DSM 16684]